MLALGAKEHAPITEQGDGFITASVVDPFGNVLGLMYNQHYLAILAESSLDGRHRLHLCPCMKSFATCFRASSLT